MKAYLATCIAIGILLGWWFAVDCERYDMHRHGGNDQWWTWTFADYQRWKELHWDRPPPGEENVPEPDDE
jgi:hypothetical protein